MATGLFFPSHSLSTSSHLSLLPNPSHFRNRTRADLGPKKFRVVEKAVVCSCDPSTPNPTLQNEFFLRRELMLSGLSSPLALVFPPSGFSATEEVKMASMVDDTNAYSYLYPVQPPSKKIVFKWVESRKPERYSSAAPLSPDARLRIVSERVDIVDNLIISVMIGPPNAEFLKLKDKSTWSAKDVADSVLADKSALRITSSQRMAASSVLDAHSSDVDGEPYWYYEYLIRKSPTKTAPESNLYRHYISSTAERDGYLYSLSASTLSKQWDVMGPFLEKTAASFRLLPPTENYVPPYKDPWRFW
ncbi:psbP domain-containing protein 5, chloroplastic [Rhododendron vialii]|uniref:psbP domain-containing protein 5, chloroplastic n=1 Tax=Rhododendron vialii TaxID=182163 RepID=UPI00265DFD8E|nr:psbP domain-containing protein 5, chloroplastic [Rhododendron vialii]